MNQKLFNCLIFGYAIGFTIYVIGTKVEDNIAIERKIAMLRDLVVEEAESSERLRKRIFELEVEVCSLNEKPTKKRN